jgi:two-component system KDP operon response regulator KdpE
MNDALARVLVVDDEPQIRKLLRIGLHAQGYEVIEAGNGQEAIRLASARAPDLVLLDLGLPDLDGRAVIARLREWSEVPIIVLSVRDAETEKVQALDAGADDYVTKPFSVAELLARLRVALRKRGSGEPAPTRLELGDLVMDLGERRAWKGGQPLSLTKKEYAILRLLMQHAGRVITHTQLLRQVWGPVHEQDTQYLRVYVRQLREKLGDDPAQPRYIATEPGVGYRLLV